MQDDSEFLELAKKASIAAGDVLLSKFRRIGHLKSKAEKDYVTDADFESEKLIIGMIKKLYPDHSFLAEESGSTQSGSEYTWVIDPLDGTNNFAFGNTFYGTSIALVKGRESVLGVINLPAFGELYWAEKGKGAFLNGNRLHVSERKKPDEMLVFYHLDPRSRKDMVMGMGERIFDAFFGVRMLGAAVMHFTQIAGGSADAWIGYCAKPWDIAAGCLIVEEAGGKVTDFSGSRWTPWSETLVVSNGKAQGKILEILDRARAP